VFVINPISGSGRALKTWARARPELVRRGLEFSEHFTAGPGDAALATRRALQAGAGQVVAVGGDGTLNEVVNGYLDRKGRPVNPEARLAILASGTGSDFRKSLYPSAPVSSLGSGPGQRLVPLDGIEESIAAITGSGTRLVDAGLINCRNRAGDPVARFFINVVSFGLGGDVSRLVNGWRGRLPAWISGRSRFAAAAIGALARYKTTPVVITTEQSEVTVQSNLLVIANGRFAGGGMMLAPQAQIDDGLFDIVTTDQASRLDVIRELPRIRRGGYLDNPKVSLLRAAQVSLMTQEPVPLDIDGESGDYAPVQFTALPSTIRFAIAAEVKSKE
jgi:YegS/Rv2252/BmrU family lipid kinase